MDNGMEEYYKAAFKLIKDYRGLVKEHKPDQVIQKIIDEADKKFPLDRDKSREFSFASLVLTIIYLNRLDFLSDKILDDQNFFGMLFGPILSKMCIGDESDEDKISAFRKYLENEAQVAQVKNIWKKLIKRRMVSLIWNFIDIYFSNYIEKHNEVDDNHFYTFVDHIDGNYNEYLRVVANAMQAIRKPDIIFLDQILIGTFKDKGLLIKIDKDYKKDNLTSIDSQIATCCTDDQLYGMPYTRNFHLPGCDTDFEEKLLEKFITKDGNKSITINGHLENLLELKTANIRRFNWENKSDKNKIDDKDLYGNIQFNSKDAFIPMQLANGAHSVYTFFAYASGSAPNNNKLSFIKIINDKDKYPNYENYHKKMPLTLEIWKKDKLSKAIFDFLLVNYLFVPFVSLCSDHRIAGLIRNNYKRIWFDLCLPLESKLFDKNYGKNIILASQPANGKNLNPMSCLGGYSLCIMENSRNKKIILSEIKKLIIEIWDGEYNKEEPINDILVKHSKDIEYNIKTPESLAIRPNFWGWPILEKILSDSIRQYCCSIYIFREFIFNISSIIDNKDTIDKIDNNKIETILDKLKIKKDLIDIDQNWIEFIVNKLNAYDKNTSEKWIQGAICRELFDENIVSSIIKKNNNEIIKYFEKNAEDGVDNKVMISNNLENILIHSHQITSKLRLGINKLFVELAHQNKMKENYEVVNRYFEILADLMATEITGHIKNICNSYNWTLFKV